MAAYKDEERGTWYVSFYHYDWTGKNKRKLKRGFKTRKEALEWKQHFWMKESSNLDMTMQDFFEAYTRDMQPRLKLNMFLTKKHIIQSKIIPYFKNKSLAEITATDIIQWQNKLLSMRDENNRPYSQTYLRTVQNQLSAIFNHASQFYGLANNPSK